MDKNVEPCEGSAKPIGRRAFLYGALGVAGVVATGGAAWAAPRNNNLLRPPGALDERAFFARCIRCDRCRSACPTSVIAPCTLEDGFLEARTPKLDFHLGFCDWCEACANVCPTGAITAYNLEFFEFSPSSPTAGLPSAGTRTYGQPPSAADDGIGTALVDEERCIAWDGASGGCQQCFIECPYQAISLDANQRPIVDEARCTGCGVCTYICPSSRLHSHKGGSKLRGINVVSRESGELQ